MEKIMWVRTTLVRMGKNNGGSDGVDCISKIFKQIKIITVLANAIGIRKFIGVYWISKSMN